MDKGKIFVGCDLHGGKQRFSFFNVQCELCVVKAIHNLCDVVEELENKLEEKP